MMLVVVFLINASLSFALSLLLAFLIGPDGFGRYAIGLAVTLVVNTALFEWLRLSTTRFYSERTRAEAPSVRRTLDLAYLAGAAILAAATLAALGAGLRLGGSSGLLAAAAFCGLTYGLCEYRMALARARFLETCYAGIGLSRAVFGFGLAAGTAVLADDPALVLAATAISALIPILLVRRTLADRAGSGSFDAALIRSFARYALPLVAASALYQLLPVLNRTLLASREGFTEAGYFALVSELATRLFQNLGAALDLVLFQLAVRADELHGREAAELQISRNAGLIAAIVCPAAAGLWLVWPVFEQLFIPPAFQGHLAGPAVFVIPAFAAFALIQYALNPAFQIRRATTPVVVAAIVAVVVDGAAVLLVPGLSGPSGFALAQLCAVGLGLAVLCATAWRSGIRLPHRDAALALGGSAAMVACLWPTRGLWIPAVALPVQVGAGAAIYGLVAWTFDLCGMRTRLVRRRAGRGCSGAV